MILIKHTVFDGCLAACSKQINRPGLGLSLLTELSKGILTPSEPAQAADKAALRFCQNTLNTAGQQFYGKRLGQNMHAGT